MFPNMPAFQRRLQLARISATLAATVLACSCSSGDKGNAGDVARANDQRLASRISAKPSLDKRSMFEPQGSSDGKKAFKSGSYTTKDFRSKEYRGSKSYKTDPFREGDRRSPWAGLTSRESAQEVPSNLSGNYKTGDSRFAGKTSRDAGESYGTETYKTGGNIVGNKAIQNSNAPKTFREVKTSSSMDESEIKTLLGKD